VSKQENIVVYEHLLPDGVKHGDTADGSLHNSGELEKLFNTRYRCVICKKIVRTYDQLHGTCYTTSTSKV